MLHNTQREERVNQGGQGNPNAAINHERERTTVHGVHGLLDKRFKRHDLILGAEYYHERIAAPSYAFNPLTGTTTVRRGRCRIMPFTRAGESICKMSGRPCQKSCSS